MTTLVERLRAALDETERVAREAGGTAWVKSSTYPDQAGVEEAATGEVVVYDEGWPTTAQAEHIALHDPERELRMVAAHRKILDLHAPSEYRIRRSGGITQVVLQCDHCASLCHSGSGLSCDEPCDAVYPCETVTLLAEAYGVEA